MPTLPAELVLAVIRLALPPLKTETFTERYSILRSCQLVCRAWALLAQAELYRHVYLPTLEAIAAFSPPLLFPPPVYESRDFARPPRLRFSRTRTMRLGKPGPAPRWRNAQDHALPILTRLWDVLCKCTSLRELSITGLVIPDFADMSVASGGLVSLNLDNVSISRQDSYRPFFRELEYVSLNRCAFWNPDASHSWSGELFHEESMPSEETLAEQAASPSFGDLVGHVNTIVLGRHNTELNLGRLELILSEATSLQHFTLNTPEFLSLYLGVIPSRLDSLQIGNHYFRQVPIQLDAAILIPILLNPPHSISHLRRLCVPEVFMWGWTGRLRERTDPTQPLVKAALVARAQLRRVCEARGIELVERKLTEDGEDFEVGHWSECLDW